MRSISWVLAYGTVDPTIAINTEEQNDFQRNPANSGSATQL
jgi:hypothetical protein